MTCPAHIWDMPTGLDCTRTDAHLTGHTYAASECPDAKTEEPNDE